MRHKSRTQQGRNPRGASVAWQAKRSTPVYRMADSDDAGARPVASSKTPGDFLQSIKGKPVVVKLNSGVDYRGVHPAFCLHASSPSCLTGSAGAPPPRPSCSPAGHSGLSQMHRISRSRHQLSTIELRIEPGSIPRIPLLQAVLTFYPRPVRRRDPRLLGWVHEYCHGADRGTDEPSCASPRPASCNRPMSCRTKPVMVYSAGIRQWSAKKQVRGCIHQRKQRCDATLR